MKRLWLGLLAGLLLALSLAPVQAVGVSEGPSSMAKYFMANTQIFLSIRTDDGYIEALDGFLSKVTRTLGENGIPVPPISLAALLAANNFGNGLTYADIRAWLGDYAALGLGGLEALAANPNAFTNGEAPLSIVLQIKDRAAATAFFERLIPPSSLAKSEEGDYIIFTDPSGNTPIFLAFGSEVMVITNRRDQLPGVSRMATLDSNSQLQEAFRRLPAPSYNIIGYVDGASFWELVTNQLPPDQLGLLEAQGLGAGTVGAVALGATILEGRTLAIDLVQQSSLVAASLASPLSADFLGLLPASADAVIAASNLSATISAALDSLSATATQAGQPDPRAQILGAVQALGIDLEEDVLSWTTGGYALIFGMDVGSVLEAVTDPSQLQAFAERLPFEFGLIVEATDSTKARSLAAKLATIFSNAAQANSSAEQTLTVNRITLGNAEVTTFTGNVPLMGSTVPLTLALGADDRVFFLGLQSTAEAVFAGGAKLVDTPAYQDAARFFVPNSFQLLYTNDEGLLGTIAIPLALFVSPSVGNLFSSSADDLQSSNGGLAQAVQSAQDSLAQSRLIVSAFNALVASSSATGAVVDGEWAISRLALTFEP